jgi:hypothetical protein
MRVFVVLIFLYAANVFAGGVIPFGFMPLHNVVTGPSPRIIATANYSDWSGTTYSTSGMSRPGFSIPTAGVQNGDLLLFIASFDNGNDTAWPNPISTGFTQLYQKYYGNDGQTFIISWKIANNEPSTYSGSYSGVISGSTAIALIAITGANASSPIGPTDFVYEVGASTGTATGSSVGVTTTTANNLIIYAGGGDWESYSTTTVMHNLPLGFSPLVSMGDRGGVPVLDWTSLQIGYKLQPSAGATGTVSGYEIGTSNGLGWGAVVAIKP